MTRPSLGSLSSSNLMTAVVLSLAAVFPACDDDGTAGPQVDAAGSGKDPATATKTPVDRFSATAGNLMVRDATNGLPAANAPIDFDQPPFITAGLGPMGQRVKYYNFDIQSDVPAPIYVLFSAGATVPFAGQLNIVDVVPGDPGYSDFWRVHKVTVPAGYVANDLTSLAEIQAAGLAIEPTTMLVNCPIVPEGSTATTRMGGGSPTLMTGWYKGMTVRYFSFEEKALGGTTVPLSPIYVAFNLNPGAEGGGPPSGFLTEAGSAQTHNVVATVPSDPGYSPLWLVNIYDNTAFSSVSNLATAQSANLLAMGVAKVNCPIVEVQGNP